MCYRPDVRYGGAKMKYTLNGFGTGLTCIFLAIRGASGNTRWLIGASIGFMIFAVTNLFINTNGARK